jgi:hypothetical protein
MHLADYMAAKNLDDETVAAAIGCHRVSVSRYRRRLERPKWQIVDKFQEWSEGAITPSDWPPPTQQAAE